MSDTRTWPDDFDRKDLIQLVDRFRADSMRFAADAASLRTEVERLTIDKKSGWYATVTREHAHQRDVEIPDLVEQVERLQEQVREARGEKPPTSKHICGGSSVCALCADRGNL